MAKPLKKEKATPIKAIQKMGERLLNDGLTVKQKEYIIMTLAHSPTKEALGILKAYEKILISMKYFTHFAIEECQWWNG